jgi:hypothetical protein
VVLIICIGSIGDGIARAIAHRYLGDLVPSPAILEVPKARMIGIELHDQISIGDGFIRIDRDRTHVDVVGK